MHRMERIIDLRLVPPSSRLREVSALCEALHVGGSVVLILDHSPRFLHYHLSERFPDVFVWNALERGPVAWRVRVTRRPPRCLDEDPETLVERDTIELRTIAAFLREDVQQAGFVDAPDLGGIRLRLSRLSRLAGRYLRQNARFLPAVELGRPRLFEGAGRVLRLQLERLPDLVARVEDMFRGAADRRALGIAAETLREIDLLLEDVAQREQEEYFPALGEALTSDARKRLAVEMRLVG